MLQHDLAMIDMSPSLKILDRDERLPCPDLPRRRNPADYRGEVSSMPCDARRHRYPPTAPPIMPRFVILRHDSPEGVHYDLMLEVGELLRTWSLPEPPAAGLAIQCRRLADHRSAYLDYEGPISGGRGSVTRWDSGIYELQQQSDTCWAVRLVGERLRGDATISRPEHCRPVGVSRQVGPACRAGLRLAGRDFRGWHALSPAKGVVGWEGRDFQPPRQRPSPGLRDVPPETRRRGQARPRPSVPLGKRDLLNSQLQISARAILTASRRLCFSMTQRIAA